MHSLVEPSAGAAEAHESGDGQMQVIFGARQCNEEVVELHDRVDFAVDAQNIRRDLLREECARNHFKREAHHLHRGVDLAALLPAIAQLRGAFDHDRSVNLNTLAVKSGCDDTALAPVDFAVTGNEALAEQNFHALLGGSLMKFWG